MAVGKGEQGTKETKAEVDGVEQSHGNYLGEPLVQHPQKRFRNEDVTFSGSFPEAVSLEESSEKERQCLAGWRSMQV